MKTRHFPSEPNSLVVGSGLTGAAIAMMKPEVVLLDKARKPGGRVSTKVSQVSGARFDIGATMFRDQMEVNWMGKVSSYNLFEIWKTCGVKIDTKPIYDLHHHYPTLGMESIVGSMLVDKTYKQSMTLKYLSQTNENEWSLNFHSHLENQSIEMVTNKVFLTLPIPQIVSIFESSDTEPKLDRWIKFLQPYNEYRKTLVSFLSWKDWKPNFESFGLKPEEPIPVSTILDRGEDWEYQSWESIKYPMDLTKGDGSSLLVQFSSLFSETHFDTWMDEEKKPNSFYQEMLAQGVKEKWSAPPPDEIWNHRWKFAQTQMPLLGREGALQLDSEEFAEWKSLCQESGITILGDWLFGSKLERIVGGVYFLAHNDLL